MTNTTKQPGAHLGSGRRAWQPRGVNLMTTNRILPRDSFTDKLSFTTRGWLNYAGILLAIVRLHLKRWPAAWTIDVLVTVLVTLLLVPAWGVYRLAALLTIGLAVATIGARRWGAQALRDLVTILGLVLLVILAGLWLLADKLEG